MRQGSVVPGSPGVGGLAPRAAAAAAAKQEEKSSSWKWILVGIFVLLAGIYYAKSSPKPRYYESPLVFSSEQAEAFAAEKGITYADPTTAEKIRDIGSHWARHVKFCGFGSTRIFLRVILRDATPEAIDLFLRQVRRYAGVPDPDSNKCVHTITAEDRKEGTAAFARMFHPDTHAQLGCGSRQGTFVVVDPNIAQAAPVYMNAIYKGLAEEPEGVISSGAEGLRHVEADPEEKTLNKVVFIWALPPGEDFEKALRSGRAAQMATHQLSLQRA
jgi:hypothetical protein